MMMWLDQLGLTHSMAQRLKLVKEMNFEINGTPAFGFEDQHFKGRMVTVVVKKKMKESQAMEN